MDAQVIVVGSYVQDHVWLTDHIPEVGETRRATGFHTGPGGKGFNQAVACQRQAVATLFVGAIGNDHLGTAARQFADGEGLVCHWQVNAKHATAASSIVVDASGNNQIVVNLAANEHLDPRFSASVVAAFNDAKLLLLQLETNLDVVAAALRLGAQVGLVRILNPAPMHADLDADMLRLCDVITPNESEFSLLLEKFSGTKVAATDIAAANDEQLHTWCRVLAVPSVVITLGKHGCFVSHDEHGDLRGDRVSHYRVAAESVQAVDTTGAGDAFNGALAAAMIRLRGQAFIDMVSHANRAAALSTERVGAATAMVDFDEVRRRFGG